MPALKIQAAYCASSEISQLSRSSAKWTSLVLVLFVSQGRIAMVRHLSRRTFVKASTASSVALLAELSLPCIGAFATHATETSNEGDLLSPMREIFNKDIVFIGLSYDLVQESGKEGFNLTVYAETVKIVGEIKLPGSNIFIHARKVVCGDNSIIDVSGKAAKDIIRKDVNGIAIKTSYSPDEITFTPPGPGANGVRGSNGSNGEDGGKVKIIAASFEGNLVVKSNGGDGGRGQSSGNGRNGSPGHPGTALQFGKGDASQINGQNGGKGGDAAPGGKGGDGGNAGSIEIKLLETNYQSFSSGKISPSGLGNAGSSSQPLSTSSQVPNGSIKVEIRWAEVATSTILLSAHGGKAGDAGKLGEPGIGGIPGPAGSVEHPCGIRSPDNCIPRVDNGSPGATGAGGVRATDPAAASDGKSISAPQDMFEFIREPLLGQTASFLQLSKLFRRASIDFISERNSDCLDSLLWIERLTRDVPGSLTPVYGDFGSPYSSKLQHTRNEWLALRNRSLSLIGNFHLGLDFYGLPKNHVPLVSYDYYKQNATLMLESSKEIEELYRRLRMEQSDINVRRRNTQDALSQTAKQIAGLSGYIKTLEPKIQMLSKEIDTLMESALAQERALQFADNSFQAAVQRKYECINFLDSLKLIYSITMLFLNTQQGVNSLIGVFEGKRDKEIEEALQKSHQDTPKWVKRLELIGSEGGNAIDKIGKAYERVKGIQDEIDRRSAKILVEKEKFEDILRPYLTMQEAVKYRDLMRVFVDTTSLMNRKDLERSALLDQVKRLENEVLHLEESVLKLREILSDIQNPYLVESALVMEEIYVITINNLMRFLYQERRALEFATLTDIPFSINPLYLDVAVLSNLHQGMVNKEFDAKNQWGRGRQRTDGVTVVLADMARGGNGVFKVVMPDAFATFKDKSSNRFGQISFAIPSAAETTERLPGVQRSSKGVTAKQVELILPGAKADREVIFASLIHSGKSYFEDSTGKGREFVHAARPTELSYRVRPGASQLNKPTEDNLRGLETEFVFLSPFTTWTLIVSPDDNPGLDLSRVTLVQLVFQLYSRPILSG